MNRDSRGGQLIGTTHSSGSRMVVDVMSYRKRRAGRIAQDTQTDFEKRRRNSDASKFTHTNIVSISILIKSFSL